jgi:hypothetical protein
MYLKSAEWGFDQLLTRKPMGYGFRFHMIGILAALRAVQHALDSHDRTLSPEHGRIIGEWWSATKDDTSIAALRFIRRSRDLILKRGSFESYATSSESTGEYDLAYYDGRSRDFRLALREALDWCDQELKKLEARLPSIRLPE